MMNDMSKEENLPYIAIIDDRRLQFLYSPYRKRELNPDGWQDKMNFWVQSIKQFSNTTKTAVFTSNDLCIAFERNKKIPACIDDVLNYMHRQNNITTVEEYIYYHLPKTWLNWSYNVFVKYPIIRIWSSIRDLFSLDHTAQKFVILDVLKVLANMILEKYEELKSSENADDVMVLEDFQKQCVNVCDESEESFKFALMQLESENKLKVFEEPGGIKIIKFKMNESQKFEISKIDQAVLRLRSAINENLHIMDEIATEQKRCVVSAKDFVKKGLKGRAVFWLKKRKHLQEGLLKRNTIQDNLEVMLSKVRNCSSEKMILDAHNAAAAALKAYLTTDLILSEIDETMDDVKECLDEFHEVQERLAGNLNDDDDLLSELEVELEDLISTEIKVDKQTEMEEEDIKASKPEITEDHAYPILLSSTLCDDMEPINSLQVDFVKKRAKENEVAL